MDANGVDVSVVISTYNRAARLPRALQSLLAQEAEGVRFEVIVVDNNSTDDTREVVRMWEGRDARVRYVFEARQGVSHGRNAGIAEARAPVIAFTDDDICVGADWVAGVHRAFLDHPETGFVGGRVVPEWSAPPPAWLTAEHWAPLALIDYGDEPFPVGPERPICLLSANLALRRDALHRMGGFSPALQRVKDGIGSMEDAELQHRLAGVKGMYVPSLRAVAPVEPERATRAYHRRWHTGHGGFNARMRAEDFERSSWRLLDVPAHVYRQALTSAVGWLAGVARADTERAFRAEVQLRFAAGFLLRRWADYRSAASKGVSC
jgi:cellulose synthase/poly-beta-1,6-N-acetylglucosamine synthase-like glycosyltransferase